MPTERNGFLCAAAVSVDFERRVVHVRSGGAAQRLVTSAEVGYDYLLIACGAPSYPCARAH